MMIDEVRRRNLRRLLASDPQRWPSQAAMAREANVSPQALASLFSPSRPFGERSARALEEALKLEGGWLDWEEGGRPQGVDDATLDLARRIQALPPRERHVLAALLESLESP